MSADTETWKIGNEFGRYLDVTIGVTDETGARRTYTFPKVRPAEPNDFVIKFDHDYDEDGAFGRMPISTDVTLTVAGRLLHATSPHGGDLCTWYATEVPAGARPPMPAASVAEVLDRHTHDVTTYDAWDLAGCDCRRWENARDHTRDDGGWAAYRAHVAAAVLAETPLGALQEAATALLALKDGPRDENYTRTKESAWQALRDAVEALT